MQLEILLGWLDGVPYLADLRQLVYTSQSRICLQDLASSSILTRTLTIALHQVLGSSTDLGISSSSPLYACV